MNDGMLPDLSPANASLPEKTRGYGHVKEAHLAKVKAEETTLLTRWRTPAALPRAAE